MSPDDPLRAILGMAAMWLLYALPVLFVSLTLRLVKYLRGKADLHTGRLQELALIIVGPILFMAGLVVLGEMQKSCM